MVLSRWPQIALTGLLTLGLWLFPAPPNGRLPAHSTADGPPAESATRAGDEGTPDLMPMQAGVRMTYSAPDGSSFSLRFGAPVNLLWFDGSMRAVTPMHDSRCGCQILLDRVGREVRAVGALVDGEPTRWGEYLLLFAEEQAGPPTPVRTAAGSFAGAMRVRTELGVIWFAPAVGMIRIGSYELIQIEDLLLRV